jgi:hypothetical protein
LLRLTECWSRGCSNERQPDDTTATRDHNFPLQPDAPITAAILRPAEVPAQHVFFRAARRLEQITNWSEIARRES